MKRGSGAVPPLAALLGQAGLPTVPLEGLSVSFGVMNGPAGGIPGDKAAAAATTAIAATHVTMKVPGEHEEKVCSRKPANSN